MLTRERQAWCYLQVKLCDPCLSALCVPWCKKALYRYFSFPFFLLRDATCCQTGCETGCRTALTTAWMFVYMTQPVVQPVVRPVLSCKRSTKGSRPVGILHMGHMTVPFMVLSPNRGMGLMLNPNGDKLYRPQATVHMRFRLFNVHNKAIFM